jgi:hypothetical protein
MASSIAADSWVGYGPKGRGLEKHVAGDALQLGRLISDAARAAAVDPFL